MRSSRSAQRRRHVWIRTVLLTVAALVLVLPLFWTLLASIGIVPDDAASPPAWTLAPSLDTYIEEIGVAEPRFAEELGTSAALALLATLWTIAIAFPGAYALARSPWRERDTFAQVFLLLGSLPFIAYAIPLAETVRRLHLHDTLAGIALAQAAAYAPLAVYVLYGYLVELAPEFEEAAMIEGAGLPDVLRRITLPMSASGVAATALIVFALDWNSFLLPLTLTAEHVRTIPVAMSDFFTFERELEWRTAAAALVASLLPLVALVAAAHHVLEHFRLTAAHRA